MRAFEQAVFDANVPSLGLSTRSEGFGLLSDGSEGQTHLVSAGPEADSLAATVGVEKVSQPLEPTFGDGSGEEAGPGGVVIQVARRDQRTSVSRSSSVNVTSATGRPMRAMRARLHIFNELQAQDTS
ncbi:hypothetical protein ACGFYM_27135 [Streptomyces sp. NPDC048231]|uniref:hypothetical protein n=1 Tax=Streptomyces sp. NPDC048231 TaxID=3365519 RepID=UPI00371B5EB0